MDEIQLKTEESIEKEAIFGKTEENAIISLAFDQPEFFSSIINYIKEEFFSRPEARFVLGFIKYHYERNDVILSRALCKDQVLDELTADDPHEDILALIDRVSDPREVPIITDKLMEWAKRKAYLQLYETETIEAVHNGEYEQVESILDEASRITNIGSQCHFFFDEVDELFVLETEEKFTTGFRGLDKVLNDGGPTRSEVCSFMAPTGKGKSIVLCNVGAMNIKNSRVVLHVTLEMTWLQTAKRYCGCFTEIPIRKRIDKKASIKRKLSSIKATYGSDLIISEFPPEDVSVDSIHAIIDMLRKRDGIKVDVVIVDYLELLLSRNPTYNKDDYIRQKRACTELARLAKKENVVVFTATQTNRGNEGSDKEKSLDINKVAESYGKTMPISYLVSINQTRKEYDIGRQDNGSVTASQIRLYVAKNRNGKAYETIQTRINYETMKMMEYEGLVELGAEKTIDNEIIDEDN
jgi:replicative DNA helicase